MSQRNPMNERYQSDERRGTTRKSAAAAKPKSKAASSVTVVPANHKTEKERAEAKAAAKEKEKKQRELNNKYYKPDTPRYKRLKAIWWVCLLLAVGCTALSFLGQEWMPDWLGIATLVGAYVFIILAFVLDLWKIRKERNAYQERMIAEEEKREKAEKAARRAEQMKKNSSNKKKGSGKNQNRHAAPKKVEVTEASDDAPVEPQKRGLFGGLLSSKSKEKAE